MDTRLLSVLLILTVIATDAAAGTIYSIAGFHLGDSCENNTPYLVYISKYADCISDSCSVTTLGSNAFTSDMTAIKCSSEYLTPMREMFSGSSYVIRSTFSDENCTTFQHSYGYPATDSCVGAYNEDQSYHYKGTLHENGLASISIFDERACLSSNLTATYNADKDALESHSCVPSGTANELSR
ncbi:hypothetical protein BBJ29_005507 [Phytophthora kernoviae]|uniref:Uncharacterized protein n=1 Tax=Phytophthora kernoviae TaxID=325452 RepID=A0A3F2RNU6_9STRA|nr:hypothetical protein BBJ29_005507 [Phytophthora kernoviae]RLN61338.1 hypothetical protein BBP00_00005459 [Phytophthora kernoviae]